MRSPTEPWVNRRARPFGEADALNDAALRLLASIERRTPASEVVHIRRRAMRLIELAQRMERDGGAIMTRQPSLREAFRSLD
jgi:hypothetical protein